ncbi:MAG: hypothetical protein ACYTEG_04780 [Planctomycetota bacterium]|jgi:hypothetical protein
MGKARMISAILLALPLVVFGANYFLHLFSIEAEGEQAGIDLMKAMQDGGLMAAIAASHVLIGALLIIPRTRFAAALLQLPISLGMVAFHVTMMPAGLAPAAVMLALNLVVLADAGRLRALLGPAPARS